MFITIEKDKTANQTPTQHEMTSGILTCCHQVKRNAVLFSPGALTVGKCTVSEWSFGSSENSWGGLSAPEAVILRMHREGMLRTSPSKLNVAVVNTLF